VVGVYIPDPEAALIRVAISHLNAVDPVSQSKVLKPADGWFAAERKWHFLVQLSGNEAEQRVYIRSRPVDQGQLSGQRRR
jgi:hypothetical protein